MGQRVHVLLDRIDREQRRLQFALVPSSEQAETKSPRKAKAAKAAELAGDSNKVAAPNRAGKRRGKPGKAKTEKAIPSAGKGQEGKAQAQIIPVTIERDSGEKTYGAHGFLHEVQG